MSTKPDHIMTTHGGSLPRPDDLVRMMWDKLDKKHVDVRLLEGRIKKAVFDVVRRQQEIGIDIISDGEMSKIGYANYVIERFSGFGSRAHFVLSDIADIPGMVDKMFINNEAAQHIVMLDLEGPIALRDKEAIKKDIAVLKEALGSRQPEQAFMAAVTPSHLLFNFANKYYKTDTEYLIAAGDALRYEYQAIIDAGFNLQLDSADLAMHAHMFSATAGQAAKPSHWIPMAIEALNYATRGLPANRCRLHLCWGNYPGPHHRDIELKDIVEPVLKANVGWIYFEAANPRHEHEWEVWEQVGDS